jgi:hypothetical protein
VLSESNSMWILSFSILSSSSPEWLDGASWSAGRPSGDQWPSHAATGRLKYEHTSSSLSLTRRRDASPLPRATAYPAASSSVTGSLHTNKRSSNSYDEVGNDSIYNSSAIDTVARCLHLVRTERVTHHLLAFSTQTQTASTTYTVDDDAAGERVTHSKRLGARAQPHRFLSRFNGTMRCHTFCTDFFYKFGWISTY